MDGLAPAFLRPDLWPGRRHDTDPGLDDLPMSFGRPPLGILYVEDFDAPAAPAPPPVPDIVTPRILPEDIARAHEAGRQAGLLEARAEQSTIQAELRTAALAAIGDALGSARADAARIAHAMADELAATLLALLQAALPAASDALAGQEITALVAALLPGLRREPSAAIRVHPSLLGEIGSSLQTLWPDHGGRLAVTPDDTIARADVRVSWEDGEARRDTRALWQSVRTALTPYALPSLESILEGVAHGG
jgi:flagellar biosynthesis/type III secretory pathway protein FliH